MAEFSKAQNAALKALNDDTSIVTRDLEAGLQGASTLPKSDQAWVIATMQTLKSHDWMTSTKSSVLFINSNTSSNGKPSSFIPAKLVQSVNTYRFNNVFAVSFFCDAHQKDPNSGVALMMRSFIAQLLRFYTDFDMETLHQIRLLNGADVHALCWTFHQLVLQLPSDIVVFCIVDAVTSYETRESQADASELAVAKLIDIVQKTRKRGCPSIVQADARPSDECGMDAIPDVVFGGIYSRKMESKHRSPQELAESIERNHIAHAPVRDPSSPEAQALQTLGIAIFHGSFDEVEVIKAAIWCCSGVFLTPFQTPQIHNYQSDTEG
ncbi:hypothetical protein TSTA_013960 [Talaromyces stipitatus ATCC 10500]|uniref:Nephrocystin 3-like N-terminal domain-containing protein n=1 Tax=Talaromyces stipitatus (strain ATCC 10500 / CBS 375.48 / QM 6759 / NRRL 1006) TaxID=441959 RepID=B8MGR7_TALSN|nr:uncharacterized protein TSTA_013960 [Talaromyces stipitatus ATCC 10500]EED16298.1 hypothetical protein TSTA_013960 [Talaromyces stipitatus ATCC 10500]